MTIKDIINTPISHLWNAISPFAIGYLIFMGVMFVVVLSFIIYVFLKVIKGHSEFDKGKKKKIGFRDRTKF